MRINKDYVEKGEGLSFFQKITIVISLLSLVTSFFALFQAKSVSFEFKEFKADLIEVSRLIAENSSIENIEGVKCITLKSGGQICSG